LPKPDRELYRFRHPEFANFVNIAKGSIGELFDSIDEATMKGYVKESEYGRWHERIERALKSASGLYTYLKNNPTPGEE